MATLLGWKRETLDVMSILCPHMHGYDLQGNPCECIEHILSLPLTDEAVALLCGSDSSDSDTTTDEVYQEEIRNDNRSFLYELILERREVVAQDQRILELEAQLRYAETRVSVLQHLVQRMMFYACAFCTILVCVFLVNFVKIHNSEDI